MKIINTGQAFLSNYDLSRFLKQLGKYVQFLLPWDVSSKKN
jgi:hypothetical protein